MPESLEEIATCALYEPTAQREAVLAREIIALRAEVTGLRLTVLGHLALESARARGESERCCTPEDGPCPLALDAIDALIAERNDARRAQEAWMNTANRRLAERDALQQQLAESRAYASELNAEITALLQQAVESRAALERIVEMWDGGGYDGGHLRQKAADALAATTPTTGGS